MERKQASDFDPEVLNLFDQYVHGLIDRRGFLERAARFAVGGVTAAMLLDALNPRFAEAQQIAKDDRRLATSRVEYDSPKGTGKVRGYLALPAKRSGRLPGVLVVHENRGLNPHIEDLARRIALEQYVAFAPDALTPLGAIVVPVVEAPMPVEAAIAAGVGPIERTGQRIAELLSLGFGLAVR